MAKFADHHRFVPNALQRNLTLLSSHVYVFSIPGLTWDVIDQLSHAYVFGTMAQTIPEGSLANELDAQGEPNENFLAAMENASKILQSAIGIQITLSVRQRILRAEWSHQARSCE